MSPRPPRITAVDLLRVLEGNGWFIDRPSGSHAVLKHQTKSGRVVVSRHAGANVKPGTRQGILDQAVLTADNLRELH